MKRSVILMGGKTYVVSLPAQWIKRYNIQKGEELHVEERANSVVVSTNKFVNAKRCEINVSEISRMLGRSIGALYKSGYNEVKVIYDTENQLKQIEETLRKTCIGFEITDQGKNYVLIKNLTHTLTEEFENSLRRLFYTIEIMNQDLVTAFQDNDTEALKQVVIKDQQVNKLADFCRRVINSGETKKVTKSTVVYYIVEQLERIGDMYKKIAQLGIKNNLSLEKEALTFLESINSLFVSYRKLYYDFSLPAMESFGKNFDELKEEVSKQNHPLKLHQEFLLEHIFDMNGALLTLRL